MRFGRLVAASVAVACFAGVTGSVANEAYPERPVTIVVGMPAGSATDVVARLVGEKLRQELKQNFVIENRPGAGTALGATHAARSEPDGYTLFFAGASSFSTNPSLYKNLGYKLDDFAAISFVAHVPLGFVVRKDFPANDLAGFQAYARQHPGKVTNATFGLGSSGHVIGESIADHLGIKVTNVHYRGSTQATNDIVAGHVDSLVEALTSSVGNIKSGSYKALALISPQRSKVLPDIPTFRELGYPELDLVAWFALFAPAKTPPALIAKLNAAVVSGVGSQDFRDRMRDLGNEAASSTPEAALDYVKDDAAKWAAIIRKFNIKLGD